MSTYPRETIEFIPVNVTRDGTTINAFDIALTRHGERPTTWAPAETLDGKTGILINGLTVGIHKIWARITDNPETPVIEVGTISIT